ncbi:MAG TPA: phosphotransferase [Permianibacter sp.]|nr:phosphotransferase [Permianibacter sp.]
MDERSQALAAWARQQAGVAIGEWQMISGDASFRRYFRLRDGERSWVAVDAPPERENAGHFVALAEALQQQGLPTPRVHGRDFARGFLLLEDFGDTLLWNALTPASVDALYGDAMALLLDWQRVGDLPLALPRYEPARLQMEMELFPTWLLEQHLQRPFTAAEQQQYSEVMQRLLANAAEQPFVLCHRDFHSRNLMLRADNARPGLIDFQDAVWGPVTYDLVSLLRDCYVEWPAEHVTQWALQYRDRLRASGAFDLADAAHDDARWLRWFDWMGLQRHLKVLGIFARLYHRDGKRGYLKDLPLTLRYCVSVAQRYCELQPFAEWLQAEVGSRLDANGEVR